MKYYLFPLGWILFVPFIFTLLSIAGRLISDPNTIHVYQGFLIVVACLFLTANFGTYTFRSFK
jgi:hypothetical protein